MARDRWLWGARPVFCCSLSPQRESKQRRPCGPHLTSTNGDLPAPNGGDQQTAPSIVWRHAGGWDKYVVEYEPLRIGCALAAH